MQPSTPIHPVSGTIFEAVQPLRPHPKVRPTSAPALETLPRHTATPDTDRCFILSGTTIVDRSESPHLYTSRKQYEVATSRTLGSLDRLDTNIPEGSPDSISPTSSPLSPKSIVVRAKEMLTPRSSKVFKALKTPQVEKIHGAFCRTKSIVKSLRRSSEKEVVVEQDPRDLLRSGYYSVSSERLFDGFDGEVQDAETSNISDEPPQLVPLRPVSKFLPDLTIIIPKNDMASGFNVEHNGTKVREEADDEQSSNDSLYVAHRRPRSSTITSVSKDEDTTTEISFHTVGETSYHYTPAAKEGDDVFTISNDMSYTQRSMTNFMAKLQGAMNPDRGYKTPSIASMTGSTISLVDTPPLSPKPRHTVLDLNRAMHPDSLRAQYSKTEPASPVLSEGVPKMWQLNHKESTCDSHVAPSLEKGLHAETLEVFEENATAEAAAIVHVEPDVVDIRRSQALKKLEWRDLDVSDEQQSDRAIRPAPLNIVPKLRPVRSSSGIGPDYEISTMPIEILYTIVFSAAYGDAKCTELASALYKALTKSGSSVTECEWDGRKQRLLLQSHLLQELKVLTQYGFMRDDVFAVIRGQIFPTRTTETMSNEDFTNYILRAVSGYKSVEDHVEEILGLAIDDEDQEFMQTSPENEVFFQREPFDPQGFVYDASSSDEHYERLRSLPSTLSTFEEWEQLPEPEPERRQNWRSLLLSKVARMFHIGYGKLMA